MNTKKEETKKYTGIILAAIMVASVFAMVMPMVSAAVNPSGATVLTNGTDSTKPATDGEQDVAQGGYVTGLNISGDSQTTKWQGYFGNVTGTIVLMDSSSNSMINWTVSSPNGGEVLACNHTSAPTWSELVAGTAANLDTACGFNATDIDSATHTYSQAASTVTVAGITISAVSAMTLPDTFETYLLKGANGTWSDYVFAAGIHNDVPGYDGATHDYQMLVPETEGTGTTTYLFYMELS